MINRRVTLSSSLIFCFLLVGFINSEAVMATEDSWVSKAPIQEARRGLGVAVVSNKIYAVGGTGNSGFCTFNEEYDIEADEWNFKASMPTARVDFGIAVYDNRMFCIGGKTPEFSDVGVNEVYDTETDTWETKTPMPSARGCLQANIVGDMIYLIGGYEWSNETSGADSSLNEVYDVATDTWTTKAPLPTPVSYYASAVVDNKIYVITSNMTQIYDTETNTWSTGAKAPSPLVLPSTATTTNEFGETQNIYVYSADADMPIYQLTTRQFTIQSYDPTTDNWTVCDSKPTGRYNTGLASVNGNLYVIGGFTLESGGSWPDVIPSIIPSSANEQYKPTEQIPEFSSLTVVSVLITVMLVVFYNKLSKSKKRKN